jgi:hypothetical protein
MSMVNSWWTLIANSSLDWTVSMTLSILPSKLRSGRCMLKNLSASVEWF